MLWHKPVKSFFSRSTKTSSNCIRTTLFPANRKLSVEQSWLGSIMWVSAGSGVSLKCSAQGRHQILFTSHALPGWCKKKKTTIFTYIISNYHCEMCTDLVENSDLYLSLHLSLSVHNEEVVSTCLCVWSCSCSAVAPPMSETHPMCSLLPGIPKLGWEQQNYLFIYCFSLSCDEGPVETASSDSRGW